MPNVHDIWSNTSFLLPKVEFDNLTSATRFERTDKDVPLVISFVDVNGTASWKKPTSKEMGIFQTLGGIRGGSDSALRQFNRSAEASSDTRWRQVMADMSDKEVELQSPRISSRPIDLGRSFGAGIGEPQSIGLMAPQQQLTFNPAAGGVGDFRTPQQQLTFNPAAGGVGDFRTPQQQPGELPGVLTDWSKIMQDIIDPSVPSWAFTSPTFNPAVGGGGDFPDTQGDFGAPFQGVQGGGRTELDIIKSLMEKGAKTDEELAALRKAQADEVAKLNKQADDLRNELSKLEGVSTGTIDKALTDEEFRSAVQAIQRGEGIPDWAIRFTLVDVPMVDEFGKQTSVPTRRTTGPTDILVDLQDRQRQAGQTREELGLQERGLTELVRATKVAERAAQSLRLEAIREATTQEGLFERQQTQAEEAQSQRLASEKLLLTQEIASSSQRRVLALEEMQFTKEEAILARGERKDELDQRATEAQNQFDLADRQLEMQRSQLAGLTGAPVPEGEVPQQTLEAQLARAGLSGQFEGAQTLEAELARGSLAARERETNLQLERDRQQQQIQNLMVQQEQLESNRRFELESALAGGRLPTGEQSLQAAMMRGVVPGGDLTLEGQQLAEQVRQFDLQQMLREAGISGLIRGDETLEAELARGQLQLGKRQTGISARLGFGQLEQQRQALEAQQARSALEAQTALTRSAFEQPFGFGAFRALGGLGAAPPPAQQPMVEGLSGLGFQIPRTPQGQGLAGTPTPPSSFFPRGIPTMGALAQTPAAGQQFLQSVLGMTGTSPSQFAQMSGAITPTARPVKLPEILRRGLPADTRA
jgi:hypothetical protein